MKSFPRRSALGRLALGLLGIAWAFVSCARSRRADLRNDHAKQLARDLERDLARLGQRDYSEHGIPVFLVGENRAGRKVAAVSSNDKESVLLADTFREHVAAFRLMRADPRGADVPKLVEVLAERDFGLSANRLPR